MDKQDYIKLLHNYLTGKATKEEQQFLISYYNLFQSEPDVMALFSKEEKENLKKGMQDAIWQNISRTEQKDEKVISVKRWLVRVAAAAVFLGLCATASLFLRNETSKNGVAVGSVEKPKENRLIRLPDGSTVIVHAGSKLNYPPSFDGLAKREVYLEGQAYFDIKHNPSAPFIVHTGKLETTVLGTAFNIKAFPNDVDIAVTVTRGKVKVSDQNSTLGIIIPNQQIVYNKQKSISTQNKVNAETYLSWKEQDLLFDDVTVAEATELLEERFNVQIVVDDPQIKSNRFTTTFAKGESLEQLIKSICEFNGAVYQYDKEKALIIISNAAKSETN